MNVKELSPEQRVELLRSLTDSFTMLDSNNNHLVTVTPAQTKIVKLIDEITESFSDPETGSPVMLSEGDKEILIQLLGIINGTRRELTARGDEEVRNLLRRLTR